MPRKKKTVEVSEPTIELTTTDNQEPTQPNGKPKRAPRRKAQPIAEEAAAAVLEPIVAPESVPAEPEIVAHVEAPTKAPRTRKKSAAAKPVEQEVPMPETSAPQSEPSPKKGRSRKPKKEEPAPAAVAEQALEGGRDENDLPIPIWRPIQRTRRAAPATAEDPAAQTPQPERAPRRSRGRDRRRPEREPQTAVASEENPGADFMDTLPVPVFRKRKGEPETVAEPKESKPTFRRPTRPEPPKPAPRPLIAIPPDAPQVVLRNGIPTLVRKGQVYPPIGFFGNSSDERRADTVFEELRLAAEAGVHLHALLVELEVNPANVDSSVSIAAYLLSRATQVDPKSQVLFRVVFVAPRGWEAQFPDAQYRTALGDSGEPSVCDGKYWGVARECLETFVRKLRLLDLRDNLLGVHLERGEWFMPVDGGYDDSPAARAKFKDWARTRYSNDEVALRASWFDGSVRFDTVQIPPYQPEGAEGDRFVRSSRKQRRYVDYHLFLSDATVDRISDLAYAAKAASEGNFLVGASYGYTFEWAHPSSGHLALGKLLRTPEIDFIAGPPSYRDREAGGSGPFPSPIDSFALNGKLYISEEDFKTAIGVGADPDEFNPIIRTPQALESLHWRGVGAALAHGSGVSWMDLWGNGWLKTASIWDRAKKVCETLVTRMAAPLADPDVAVFVDERALAYLVDPNAFRLLIQNAREAAMRSGLSVGFFLLSDLAHRERFPECKLYLFLNAWDIRPELRSAIKERLQKDNKVLFWLYSAGLFDSGRDSIERARDVTGIALKPQPFHSRSGSAILNRRHPLVEAFPNRTIASSALEPSYFGINEDALVLGEYTQTGLPSFLVKEFTEQADGGGRWTSVFLGEPAVTPALIRALGEMAGAHIWNFQDDVAHVRPPFLVIHCKEAGPRAVTLPSKWAAYNLVTQEWAAEETTHLRFTATPGSTHVFLVGLHGELESLLATDPSDLLHMEYVPERSENTVRFDAVSFDVPIMRLDEWIEGGLTDDVVEELLFRPKFEEEEQAQEPEETSSPGRRRRRGRGNGRRGGEEPTTARREGADRQAFSSELDINVMFRKRE